MNIMFKVGDTDFSDKVIGQEYKVQSDPQYKAWTDANGREHRSVYRYQAKGSFIMLFKTIELYQAFCATLAANAQNDTSYRCTVFDNKTDTEITSDFFISCTPSRSIGPSWEDSVGRVTINIEER